VLRAPRTKATIAQLATHTSGLEYEFWNADIAKYLKSVGIQTHSIMEICELAETLVAQKAMAKGEALKKALREKSTTVFQISDQGIREAVQLVEGNRKGS